jgi:competence protein ComEC
MTAQYQPVGDGGIKSLIPSAWLIVPTLGLLAGQAAASIAIPPAAAALPVLPLLFVFIPAWRRQALLAVIAASTLSIGYLRHRELLFPQFPADHLRSIMTAGDGRLYLEGMLRHEPERLLNRSRWHIRAERIWHPTGAQETHGDLLINLRAVRRDWRYGDRVRFQIRPVAPRNGGNPGGFEYATYLARRGIYVTGFLDSDQEIELLARSPPPVRGLVEDLRRGIRRFVEGSFSPDNGPLINALVVGETGGISRDRRAAFTASGLNHVLAISGLHVGMLGLAVFALVRYGCSLSDHLALRWNIMKVAAVVSFLAVVFYAALAGSKVPTLRAAIMLGVYQLAVLLDREEEVFASLTLAALVIALIWPAAVADLSFQLSFLAVLAIVWGLRKLHQWFPAQRREQLPQERSRILRRLRQTGMYLSVPFMATLGTGPIIAYYFGHLSLAGFIANPLVVPLVGFVVVPFGLTIGLFALIAPDAARCLVWIAEYPVSWTAWLVESFARLPMAKIAVPSPNPVEVALLYALLLSVFAIRRKLHLAMALALIGVLLAVNGIYWWHERYRRREIRVAHLNVGQGDAAVVELPGSKVLLIDAGGVAVGDFDTGEAIVAPYLRSRKILKLDYAAVTHARIDHYGGMRAIVEQFMPTEFWSGPARGNTRRFEDLEEALERAKIPNVALREGAACRDFDGARVCALYPPGDVGADAPVVLRLEFGRLRYLFSSDIDKRDEAALLRKGEDLQSAVMTVPRHGSATASTREFIARARPKVAIVSAGGRGGAGARRDEVLERYRETGAEVLRTYEDGAIIVESDGRTLRYHGYKSGKKGVMDLTAENAEGAKGSQNRK